jgi:3',5'-cyclic AMP phosphodiesterase CpdA
MRTAIVSDLHLGGAVGDDVLRDPAIAELLVAELAGADRVVLLGDVVELRDLALGLALEAARPFFAALGEALAGREVTIVPGNHDHRFAEPLLDELSLAGAPLELEHRYEPSPGPTAKIAEWLAPARLRLGYPGIWLRDDVYATHGHYIDPHLTLPRAECIAAATVMRLTGTIPAVAAPADYERVLAPIYGLGYGFAQGRRRRFRRSGHPAESAWKLLSGVDGDAGPRQRLTRSAVRASFPAFIGGVNRLLHAEFVPDVSSEAIFLSGLEAGAEMAARLGVDGSHVITGHTHRGGPEPDDGEWPLRGGGRLHNTGNWVFATAFHHPGRPPGPYWPGTVTWLEDEGPPHRVHLLREHTHSGLSETINRTA